ncbi:MAG TPA: endonuclease/exonuclease/phosphatase family protein [Gemmataceae bacterium]|nr:endonuclease/exonuclease/phosphatase family protein [Gemmataceae bacterium]
MDGDALDSAKLAALTAESLPDIVGLQEASPAQATAVFAKGPSSVWAGGEFCLASRFPIAATKPVQIVHRGRVIAVRHELLTPNGPLYFVNVHLETARKGLEHVFRAPLYGIWTTNRNLWVRRRESESARRLTDDVAGALLVAGDFNLPTDSAIYRQCWSPFTNAFSSVGLGFGYTKYTPGLWGGIRIDHVLGNPGWRCRRCWVGPDVGSDHRPLLADMEWTGPGP